MVPARRCANRLATRVNRATTDAALVLISCRVNSTEPSSAADIQAAIAVASAIAERQHRRLIGRAGPRLALRLYSSISVRKKSSTQRQHCRLSYSCVPLAKQPIVSWRTGHWPSTARSLASRLGANRGKNHPPATSEFDLSMSLSDLDVLYARN